MKRGKEWEKKSESHDSFTLSSEVEILKTCLTQHTQKHTLAHTTLAQGEPRSPFGVPPCVMCFEQQPVIECGASNSFSKGEKCILTCVRNCYSIQSAKWLPATRQMVPHYCRSVFLACRCAFIFSFILFIFWCPGLLIDGVRWWNCSSVSFTSTHLVLTTDGSRRFFLQS